MTRDAEISDQQINCFIDGELTPDQMDVVADALARDTALAARTDALRADKQRLAQIFGPIAEQKLPAAWLRLIETAPSVPRGRPSRRLWWMTAAAALLAALLGAGSLWLHPGGATILADAAAARNGAMHADRSITGPALAAGQANDSLLAAAIGTPAKVPDLSRFGYRLVSFTLFGVHPGRQSAGLVYQKPGAAPLTLFVKASDGATRFDMLRQGRQRICIWQDDVVGAVLTGEMSAGEMMRVASKAYLDLGI